QARELEELHRQRCQTSITFLERHLVQLSEFTEQKTNRPTIGHDVMQHQEKNVLFIRYFLEDGSQKRSTEKIEWLPPFQYGLFPCCLVALRERHARKVYKFQ